MTEQTGQEAVEEIASEPNLDFFFDKNPRDLTDADLLALIEMERGKRALFIEKKGK